MIIKFEDLDLTLTAQPVSQVALDVIILELGGYAELFKQSQMLKQENGEVLVADYIRALPVAEQEQRNKALHKQMVYLFGWGIADEVPHGALAILEALDCNSEIPQIQRANWLIYAADLNRQHKAKIIGYVMAVTRAVSR